MTYGIRIACTLKLPRVRFLVRVKAVWWFSAPFRNVIWKESSGLVSADLHSLSGEWISVQFPLRFCMDACFLGAAEKLVL